MKHAFYWKFGSVSILLLGTLSECIANELDDRNYWNVSSEFFLGSSLLYAYIYNSADLIDTRDIFIVMVC